MFATAYEWRVWQDVKLPDGKILIPGVVSHATASPGASGAGRTRRYAGAPRPPAARPKQRALTLLNWRKTDICILRGHFETPTRDIFKSGGISTQSAAPSADRSLSRLADYDRPRRLETT